MSQSDAKQAELDAAVAEGPPRSLRLTPQQLAITLLFEAHVAHLQIGANQLGGFLKETEAAEVLISAAKHIEKAKVRLQSRWAKNPENQEGVMAPPPVRESVEDTEVVP